MISTELSAEKIWEELLQRNAQFMEAEERSRVDEEERCLGA